MRAAADAELFALIDERRAEAGERDDVLSLLLGARHEDGSPMSAQELRDELMTLLVAGHETTASQLAFTFERLVRTPEVLARLTEEVAAATATPISRRPCRRRLRRRPVLPNAAPRLVMQEIEVGGWRYPAGSAWSPTPTSSTTTPRSIPSPTPSAPSASSSSRRAPTRGSPSAAGAGAASARRSRPWR